MVRRMRCRSSAQITKSASFHWENRNCVSRSERCRWLRFIFWAIAAAIPRRLVEELAPQKAFLALVANTFATNTLDSGMRAKEFEILARLAPSVPIRALCAHHDASRLPELCALLNEEAQKLRTRNSARV